MDVSILHRLFIIRVVEKRILGFIAVLLCCVTSFELPAQARLLKDIGTTPVITSAHVQPGTSDGTFFMLGASILCSARTYRDGQSLVGVDPLVKSHRILVPELRTLPLA